MANRIEGAPFFSSSPPLSQSSLTLRAAFGLANPFGTTLSFRACLETAVVMKSVFSLIN
ncbi:MULTISPECIES: hypothetical protein [Oceanicaulis]|uniref:hypothetical protein n=1 Tax=Oceanicaulis TaxID=153232 RepID=UPI0023570593|nr:MULTISPECIES: hypothetical protein [Oceanicaulis]|tara:strand:- start:98 stop:274 length:177 start_codon:yes stop_codon:yes gene_type:complete